MASDLPPVSGITLREPLRRFPDSTRNLFTILGEGAANVICEPVSAGSANIAFPAMVAKLGTSFPFLVLNIL